jgi:hypothetical protein
MDNKYSYAGKISGVAFNKSIIISFALSVELEIIAEFNVVTENSPK